jgi:hypothetical protein
MKAKLLFPLFALLFSLFCFSQDLTMQNGLWTECDFLFTDSGGSSDNYGSNENFTLTLCPQDNTQFVSIDFFEFSTQLNADILSVYDGDSVNSPLIGAYSGLNIPEIVRAYNAEGCLTLTFVSNGSGITAGWQAEVNCFTFPVVVSQASDMVVCDDDYDDLADFDLEFQSALILGGIGPDEFAITYHITQGEAEQQVNPVVSPYTNVMNPQTMYLSITENSTGTMETDSFDLIVTPIPEPNLLTIYEVCDGFSAVADSGLNNPDYQYTWYYNGFNLENETDPFLEVSQQGAYTLQVLSAITGCTALSDFEVLAFSFEDIVSPTPLVVCDDDGDGFATFNLESKTAEILGGNQNPIFFVTYHENFTDADTGTNPIVELYSNVTASMQTMFVRVASEIGDCYTTRTLDLIVETDCLSASSVEVIVCGEYPNIPVDYDLTSQEANIVNGQNPSDFTFAYYNSETNAQSETNPIITPQAYSVSGNSSVVHVRIEDNISGNSIIVQIFVNFNLNPQIDFNGPFTICSGNEIILFPFINNDNGPYDYLWSTGETDQEIIVNTGGSYTVTVTDLITGCISSTSVEVIEGGDAPVLGDVADLFTCIPNTTFDLTTTLPEILNGQDPSQFIISFFDDANSAFSNTNAIFNATAFIALEATETIFVRVQNSVGDCFAISDFIITTDNSCPVTIDCGQPINNTFCYVSMQINEFSYESPDNSLLQVIFNAGQVEINFDALVVLDSDGVTNLNPAETTYGNNGDLTGLSFTSTGNSIRVAVLADDSISCFNQDYTPIDYDVSCVNLDAIPNCNVQLLQPLDEASNVDENSVLTWTTPSGIVTGYKVSLGLTSGGTELLDNEDVGNVLTYDAGELLEFEVTYYVIIVPYNANGDAEGCVEKSFTTRANPNQIVICDDGAVNTAYCYENDDTTEFSFQSSDGLSLTIVFNSGSTEVNFDEVYVVDSDGTVLNPNLTYGNQGDFTGLTYTSSGDSLTVRFDSDFSVGCSTGSACCATEFEFDVFCTSSVGFIQVNAFVDANANSIYENNEFSFSNGYFTYEINGDGMINTVNSSTGSFQVISGDETDVYDIAFNLYDESVACYDITTASFSNISVATGSTVILDFPVVEEQSCEDLAVYLINNWAPPRPGFIHDNYLYLENLGFTNIASGTVEFNLDPQLVLNDIFSLNPAYIITNTATGFTVDFVNLQPGDIESIGISILCPVDVALDDIVSNTATYLTDTNDMVVSNNYSTLSEVVIGSYDPNDKVESHGPRVVYDEFSISDEWLYYTIRFQNLGTAEAVFVRIEDAIDDQLDKTTFQMLRSSHDYVVTRTDNNLEWFFGDINLPAEQDDAEGSIGFVYFRIKPQVGYAVGDIIPNTAAIYFDFNAPVITNRFETEFVAPLSIPSFEDRSFVMFPNPANEMVTIKLNSNSYENTILKVYDMQGKQILEQLHDDINLIQLDVSELQSGLYFVQLSNAIFQQIEKLVIE